MPGNGTARKEVRRGAVVVGRQRYKCVVCGIEIEGREDANGYVYAYDRGPYDGSPVKNSICFECKQPERERAS